MPNPLLQQIHIDVARNATDDFNPFHDPNRWQKIRSNPFDGPIALGFQLAALALDRISLHRQMADEAELAWKHQLHFSNYQFSFASAVTTGAELEVQVRATSNRIASRGELSNRVIVKHDGRLALMGSRKDSRQAAIDLRASPDLSPSDPSIPDRSFLPGTDYFVKRKYLMTSNGKNFCAGCFIPQHRYFDELADKVYFPPAFVLSLISCALLERAWQEGKNFEVTPYMYTSHRFSFDKRLQRELKSNDRIHLLVSSARARRVEGGLGGSAIPQIQHDCIGMLDGDRVLFRGEVGLAELQDVLSVL